MHDTSGFNKFAKDNGASPLQLDEGLILQKEIREEIIFWGSVYGSEFVEMPDNAFTSEPAYRTWCWKTTGMMPRKKGTGFDDYIRGKMLEAIVKESLPGMEEGSVIEDMIMPVFRYKLKSRQARDLDDPEQSKDLLHKEWCFLETRPDSPCGQEFFLKVSGLAYHLSEQSRHGMTEVKFERKPVCKWLARHGRQFGREDSPNRVRCTYAISVKLIEDWGDRT